MRTEFTKKNELREAIIKLIDDRDRDHDELSAKCAEYSKQITTCTLHNFSICAARLNDHIRAHHLMLSVVSRLVDFALMWERDRFYLLLGMLYRQWSDAGQGLQFVAKAIGIDNVMNHGIARGDVEVTNRKLLPIWNEEDGFAFHHDQQLITRAESWLEGEFKADFLRQFKEGSQNPKDIGRKRGPGQTKDYNSGKNKIRNDLAHYNVLHPTKNDRLNLTMLVNAVRSLFGHDRKMKNVIPRAIHDVLAREGVTIDWMIKDDRLRHPLILPVIETHLDKVRPVAGRLAPVMVPQVSVRFVSMVKALFEHDNGGYRALVTDATGRKSRKGVMRYPKELFGKAAGAMPNALESSSIP